MNRTANDDDRQNSGETKPEVANPKKGLAARLQEISRETGPMINDGRTSKELMDDLYDEETGLPK
jgi:hypothetical protein